MDHGGGAAARATAAVPRLHPPGKRSSPHGGSLKGTPCRAWAQIGFVAVCTGLHVTARSRASVRFPICLHGVKEQEFY